MPKKLSERRYMQYVAAITAALTSAASSAYHVWPSPTLPILQSDHSPLGKPISNDEASWLVSILLLASLLGAILGGWMVEKAGRKKSLLMVSAILFFPWIIIIFAKSVWLLYLARFIAGVGSGILVIACSVYNGEIAEDDIRGKLGTTFVGLKLVGTLIVLGVGPYVSYTWLAVICASMPIVSFIAFSFMPESPYYLLKTGDREGAKRSITILSSNALDEKNIDKKLIDMEVNIDNAAMNKTTVWEFLTSRNYRRSIIIMAGIKTLQQLSGMAAIEAYMQTIISMTNSTISPSVSSIIFGAVQLPSVLLASFLVDKVGRKPLITISATGCALALFGEGIYFYIQDVIHGETVNISWLPTTALALFMIMSSLGVISLPYVLLGELFSNNIKGIAVSITTFYGTFLAFAVSKSFDPMVKAFGIHVVFWIFCGCCLTGGILVGCLLPETKGKSFAAIQAKLNGTSKQDISTIS